MLDVGVFSPFGGQHDRNIAFCRDTDVHHIVLPLEVDLENLPTTATLAALVRQYDDEGITLAALTPPRIPQTAFVDAGVRDSQLAAFDSLFRSMGSAGIPFVHLYLNVDPLDDEGQRSSLWDGLVQLYRQLISSAEKAGVRVSTHHYHRPDRLLWNYATMSELLGEVSSPCNGVTYCQGKSQMAGDDLVQDILNYGDQIFIFHIRDVLTALPDSMKSTAELDQRLADIGYLEVPFGTGEVDMVGSIRALKQIGYKGQIYPEHYPAIAGDPAAGLAWTIGYIRALDQAIEV